MFSLAIERNFLSWLRFSVALVVAGMPYCLRLKTVFPPKEDKDQHPYSVLPGLFYIFLGIFVLIWALFNYFKFQKMLAERQMSVQHETIHFFVAAFVGFTIFMECIFSIMREDG